MRTAWLMLGTAVLMAAQPARDGGVLDRAREMLRAEIERLPKYMCTETVDRTYFTGTRQPRAGCDLIVAQRRSGQTKVLAFATDRLRFDVEIADGGYEIVSWPGAGRIGTERMEDMASGGPIGTGPFGPFLIDIFANTGAQIDYVRKQNGELEYRFRVPLAASHYRVGADALYRAAAYDGRFWLDAESAQLKRIEVRTAELPRDTRACEATTQVDFTAARIGAGAYLIPTQGRLTVIGRDGDETTNVTKYAACHEFHGESTIHFDDAPATEAAAEKGPTRNGRAIPGGLLVTLAMQSGIDTATAAAGDPVTAKVVKDVIDPVSQRIVLEAGEVVGGRIVHMEHRLLEHHFLMTVRFDSPALILDHTLGIADPTEINPKAPPCSATVRQVQSVGRLPAGGTFVLPEKNGRHVTPAGCTSRWVTVLPSEK
jgi:hypothetical protein